MNQKEVGELRRRFRPEKSNIDHIYGCYVNASSREIVSYLDEPLSLTATEESEKYLNILKKTLSGTLGRNLLDVIFTTQQVMDSEEHRLLSALRSTGLKDPDARNTFYQKIIQNVDMGETNYIILLACDAYDVPHKGRDGEFQPDASDEVFTYILSCVCPVKGCRMQLGYFPGENEFHGCAAGQVISAPEMGFLFPAFDNRAANIYNALFYTRSQNQLHSDYIDAVFHTDPPMSAAEQREAFETALSDALEEDFQMEVAQSVHEQLLERIERHKESHDPEPLAVTPREVGSILQSCGVTQLRVEAFESHCTEQFGENAVLNPMNLIDSKRFEVKTPEITISVKPECSYLIETCVIDGRKYLLIPVGDGVEINGLPVGISDRTVPAAEIIPAEAVPTKIP
ncbi:MAG: DUF4317 domain-containing protein [Oscillospiraceae bacterium]|nr:DUF4317 domain-containing protein [Oscillospiraceae bacterium]